MSQPAKPRPRRTSFGNARKRPDIPAPVKSTWEANIYRLYRYLKEEGIVLDFSYEPRRYEFPIKRGINFYIPDFEITYPTGKVILLEIKGHMDQDSRTKLNRMAKFYPEIEIDLIGKAAYKDLTEQYCGLVPNWE